MKSAQFRDMVKGRGWWRIWPRRTRRRRASALAAIEASGTWRTPNPVGAGDIAAEGEAEFADQSPMAFIFGRDRGVYAGRTTLVAGSGLLPDEFFIQSPIGGQTTRNNTGRLLILAREKPNKANHPDTSSGPTIAKYLILFHNCRVLSRNVHLKRTPGAGDVSMARRLGILLPDANPCRASRTPWCPLRIWLGALRTREAQRRTTALAVIAFEGLNAGMDRETLTRSLKALALELEGLRQHP